MIDNDPMPVFVIKGQDALAPDAVHAYERLCREAGLDRQASQAALACEEICDWQARNPDRLKLPDHPHRPARNVPGEPSSAPNERANAPRIEPNAPQVSAPSGSDQGGRE